MRRNRDDYTIARRANAILLLDDGESCARTAKVLDLDDDTIRGWDETCRQDGWDALAFDGWKGGESRLPQTQEVGLCAWLEGRFWHSTVEIQAHISAEFDVEHLHSDCIKLLARPGFEYRKPRLRPLQRVASAQMQATFVALHERLMHEIPLDEAVCFPGAVHPKYQTKSASGWAKVGSNPAVLSTAGRGRVNIHGALNLETFDAPFVESTTVDGVCAGQLLAKIEARNPSKRIIHVILDNAARHKGPDVTSFLARSACRIHLINLPPDCPPLDPIKRLWAVRHHYSTHNQNDPSQNQFSDAILVLMREIIPQTWKDFRDKVSDNLRVITLENLRVLE